MLVFRNIYTNINLTPAQMNYQNASINDWLDNNGKSSRSINHLVKIDYRTASKSILAEKGYTPSTVNANEPEECVDTFKSKQYIYKTIYNDFFLDKRLSHSEKAYLIAMDFAWLKNDNQQILPICHLETVTKYFNFVKINTLKKYIKNLEEKGYIKYTSNRNGITNVSIDYTGNYSSIPEEFKPAEEEINEMIGYTSIVETTETIKSQENQINELKETIAILQKKLDETIIFFQNQINELKEKGNNQIENFEEKIDKDLKNNQIEENNTVTLTVEDDISDTKIDMCDEDDISETTTETCDEDDILQILDNLETPETVKPKPSKDSLFAIVNPDIVNELKNEAMAELQHRSRTWNDLKGAEDLQKIMSEKKNNKEELANYIVDYINNNKNIRNTVYCLDKIYYKIFFTLAKEKIENIKNSYWKRNIQIMDLNLDFELKETA